MTHSFGGTWTQRKIAVLQEYLQCYATALKNQPFTLHYVDAFAGTGSHAPIVEEAQELLLPIESFRGSVLAALQVEPGFDVYHFNELNPAHVEELHKIQREYSDKQILISQCDANEFVPKFCKTLTHRDRAVLFLDPYSTELDWATLIHVAASEKVDLWLLFPLLATLRMTPKAGTKIRPEWKGTLDRLLGTDDWEKALYKPVELPPIDDLFGDRNPEPFAERLNALELEHWITNRLRSQFAYVEPPYPLTNNGHPLFLLYFAVSNKNPNAWGLAKRMASHIMSKNVGNG
jgi:three-Cys-motif partner protein